VASESIDSMMSEIEMMSRLRHPNIVQFLACVFEPYVCLVLEFATKGSLRALLDTKKSGFEFKWREHASMVLDVARAINYLHSAFVPPIAHRDIKPDNVR
jgi:serine/threonine protein kinase